MPNVNSFLTETPSVQDSILEKNCEQSNKLCSPFRKHENLSCEKMNSGKRHVHWDLDQEKKYVEFLAEKPELFDLPLRDRKIKAIHIQMSSFVGSRTPNQCRSHHQKMVKRYNLVENIVKQLTAKIIAKQRKNGSVNFSTRKLISQQKQNEKYKEQTSKQIKHQNSHNPLERESEQAILNPFQPLIDDFSGSHWEHIGFQEIRQLKKNDTFQLILFDIENSFSHPVKSFSEIYFEEQEKEHLQYME